MTNENKIQWIITKPLTHAYILDETDDDDPTHLKVPKNILDILFKETNPKLNENNFNLFSEYEKKKVLQNNLIHELPTPIIPINRNFSNYESMIDSLQDELP